MLKLLIMNFKKYLTPHKHFLNNPKECNIFSWYYAPYVKGTYNNHEVAYGVDISRTHSGYHYDLYCKIKLKNPPSVPFYLKDSLFLGGNDYFRNNWLYTYKYQYSGSKKKIKKYFETSIGSFLEKQLPRIENKVNRIETGELNISKFIKKQADSFKKGFFITIIIIIIAIIICYFLVENPSLYFFITNIFS